MLVNIGKRSLSEGLPELLLECHQRIRSFTGLAAALGSGSVTSAEAGELAVRVHRYFAEALPLHVRDEEESLMPRLVGLDREVDAALARMHREHAEHTPVLEELLSLTRRIGEEPTFIEIAAPRMASVASRLGADFEVHLAGEEQTVFPAIQRLLSQDAQAACVRELRARRAPASPKT